MFVIFDVKIGTTDGDIWFDSSHMFPTKIHENNRSNRLAYESVNVYNINDFPTYTVDIDFGKGENENSPVQKSVKILEEITSDVVDVCPVGKALGVNKGCTAGEGTVWQTIYKNKVYRFKIVGKPRNVSKVTALVSTDTEKLESPEAFVNYAVTENRLNQGIDVVFKSKNIEPAMSNMKEFIKWVIDDVMKEESDTLANNNLTRKQINPCLNIVAREWFVNYVNEQAYK